VPRAYETLNPGLSIGLTYCLPYTSLHTQIKFKHETIYQEFNPKTKTKIIVKNEFDGISSFIELPPALMQSVKRKQFVR